MSDTYDEFNNEEDEEINNSYIFDINTETKTPNIKSLRLDWDDSTLQIPVYQRKFVWTIKQASLFIESLMLDLPIPTLMFLVNEDGNNLIIDGQQRIKSILYFIGAMQETQVSAKEQKYKDFKLQELPKDSPWQNLGFSDFAEKDKKKLLDKSLSITYITLSDPTDLRGIFYIFERLNKNGTMLTAQEIRNCIYSGTFNDFLLELNKYPNWRKIFTSDEDISRQRDVELILRFFALRDNANIYERPMKEFLSKYMEDPSIRNMDVVNLAQKEKIFKETVDAIIYNLGNKPFNAKGKLNSSVLDSVMVAFSNNLKNIPDNILKKYKVICSDKEFYTYCSKSANNVDSVKNRLQMANDFLFNIVDEINLKIIKLYVLPVSAGMGNFLHDENVQYNEIETTNRKADFALRVSGDSMEPTYCNGDIILIKSQKNINSGQIGIFLYDDEVRLKKFYKNKKNASLLSLNKKYSPLNISSNKKLVSLGIVLGVYTPVDIVIE